MAEKKKKQKRIYFKNVDEEGKTVLFPGVKKRKAKKVGKENGHDVTFSRGSGAARPQKFRKDG